MPDPSPRLLTRAEVARMFRVDARTVTRWATERRIPAILTPGGRYRYPADAVERFAQDETWRGGGVNGDVNAEGRP